MASLNRVQLIGHLGKDPETKYMPSGDAVTNVSIATSEKWTDKASGEEKEQTEWHRIVFWGRLAEIAGEYLKKGAQVYVEGKIQTRKWQDKDGHDRYTTEIRADRMVMLGSRGGNTSASDDRARDQADTARDAQRGTGSSSAKPGAAPAGAAKKPAGTFDDMEDDIPF